MENLVFLLEKTVIFPGKSTRFFRMGCCMGSTF